MTNIFAKRPTLAPTMTIYLLHFDRPVGHAWHYLGSCETDRLHARMREHQHQRGAALTRRASQLGIGFSLARTWLEEDRSHERRLKRRGHMSDLCPLCAAPLTPGRTFVHFPPVRLTANAWASLSH